MRVIWTPRAVADLNGIVRSIRWDRPEAAPRIAERIFESAAALAHTPSMGRIGVVPGTRELVFGTLPYIVVYRLLGEEVRILRVRHAARMWPSSS